MLLINLVFVIDSKFIAPLEVTLTSIVSNALPDDELNFQIITFDPISDIQVSRFKCLVHPHKFKIQNFNVSKLEPFIQAFATSDRKLPITSLGRLWLPYIVDDVDRVIYLDADTVVLKSLRSLYETEMENIYFGGVYDHGTPDRHFQDYIGLGRLSKFSYVNSGVMVMNLKLMRDHDYLEGQTDMIVKILERAPCHDQDVINILYQHQIKLLDPKYNTFGSDRITDQTTIVHFLGDTKPWNAPTPNQQIWIKYQKLSISKC